jgi:3-oxoacyl-[acyl-carrier protein] reductase
VRGAGELPRALAHAAGVTAERLGAPIPTGTDSVVLVVDEVPAEVHPFPGTTPERWRRDVEMPIAAVIGALNGVRTAMTGGGRVVVVVPTLGMAGAPGLVSYLTAVEGIRALVKSAARQWAGEGIGITMVAVPVGLLAPALAGADTHLTAPARPPDDTLIATAVETVAFLLRRDLDALIGTTAVIDGGSVMLP